MDRLKLKAELTRDEANVLDAYRDSVGLWTIGVGHCLGIKKRMESITHDESDALLDMDIRDAEARVNALGLDLDDIRQRALINMSFNLGNRLLEFKKFIAALRLKDWPTAGAELEASKWYKQVGSRAARIKAVVETGGEA